MSLRLNALLKESHFVKRGSAYFRVHGEGILQVLRYDKRTGRLNVGLFSMYSELRPQWFTALGCIPRYQLTDIADEPCFSIEDFLYSRGLPWLESIDTHSKMLDALFLLETKRGGSVLWIDELKIVPFLMCQDYTSAEKVILAILDNHRLARKMNKALFSSADHYRSYVEQRTYDDERFLELLNIVQKRDGQKIHSYLIDNYAQNNQFANFCKR